MQHSILWQVLGMVNVILVVLQVAACALLLRERGPGVWLMLAGSVVWMGHDLFFQIAPFLSNLLIGEDLWLVFYAVGPCGGALFVAGLLMVALRRRATSRRVAELELIIADLQGRAGR